MISNVERVLKEAFEKTQMDSLAMGKLEGREEGREEGRVEEKQEVAKKLLSLKVDIETIQEVTGLEKEEIQRLVQ